MNKKKQEKEAMSTENQSNSTIGEQEITDKNSVTDTSETSSDQTINEEKQEEKILTEEEKQILKISNLEEQVGLLNDKYLRLFAEFDNYKRRVNKERIEFFKMAGEEMIVALLPVLDDFERAKKSMAESSDCNAIKEGIDLIHGKLKTLLNQKGLQEMEAAEKVFDTDYHEAITNIPASTEDQKGKVVDVVEKGYTLGGKVIRFAKVVVAN